MFKRADIGILIIIMAFVAAVKPVMADEKYYPIGSSPLDIETPFAGETYYPEGPPDVVHEGVNFWYYNDGTGKLDLNLITLPHQKMVSSPTVVSPDFNHLMYTEIYNYSDVNQVVSKCYYIPVVLPGSHDDGTPVTIKDILDSYQVRHSQNSRYEVLSVGTSNFHRNVFRTLTIVDWSYDSTRVLIKEHIGQMRKGLYGTIVWVYDVDNDNVFRVDTIRKAIIDYWLRTKNLDLDQHIWDIDILGWEQYSNNRFIVNAYLYPAKGQSKFLGCWMGDIRGNTTILQSLEDENWPVDRNGLIPEQE